MITPSSVHRSALGLRAELARYLGIQPLLALGGVVAGVVVMAASALEDLRLYPERAEAIAAMGTPAGAVQTAAVQLSTAVGVCATLVVVLFGWQADPQYQMTETLLLFERRRWLLLVRKTVVALAVFGVTAVLCAIAVFGVMRLGLPLSDQAVSPARVPWSRAGLDAARALPVVLFYLGVIVTIGNVVRAITPLVSISGGALLATLPLSNVDGVARWLPHRWIADWMELPKSTQFAAYFWPSSSRPALASGAVIFTLAVAALVAATWSYLSVNLAARDE